MVMSLDAFHNILIDRDGGVATITINRPKVLNALNTQTLDELRRAMLAFRRDDSVRAVIVTGAGEKSFIAGADINELAVQTPTGGREHAMRGQHVLDLIENLGKPVIAAINGYALGGGCELAMACTIRIAADTARLGQPEINLGIIPGYAGTQRLARLVGRGRALELLLTGDQISAAEALRLGLVNRVVPAAELMAEATQARARAGREGADRGALHHRRGQQGPRDAVRARRRCSKRRSSGSCRAPTTCARERRRSSRSARRSSRGSSAVRHRDSAAPPAALPGAAGFRFAIVVSRFNESITEALRDGARAALVEAGAGAPDVEELSVPGAFELPQAARCAAETGRFDAIVCLGCVIRGETPHFEYISSAVAHGIMDAAGDTGVPMAFGVLTTDIAGAGRGTGRARPRQQRVGSGGRGDRDGRPLSPARPSARAGRRRPSVRVRAGDARVRLVTRTDATGRRRAREAALQMLYQWEVGRSSADEAVATYWPEHDAAHELPEPLREFANGLVRGTIARRRGDRRAARGARAELAHRAHGGHRPAGAPPGDLRAAGGGGHAAQGDHQRGARAGAHLLSGDEAVGFVNGVLDAVRKELNRE